MSGWTQAGSCPRCGAPFWVPTVWWSVMPPVPTRTCDCFPPPRTYQTTGTGTLAPWCGVCHGYHIPGAGPCTASYS